MKSVEFRFSYNAFIRVLMTPMLLGPRYSTVRVDDDHVSVRMGLGGWAFAAIVPRASITEVARARMARPVAGQRLEQRSRAHDDRAQSTWPLPRVPATSSPIDREPRRSG